MYIKAMLMRLEDAMNRHDLADQMVLLPESESSASKRAKSTQSINLVVGYNGSPNSQTALDLTMWMAHQTRLATQKQVNVQVVYVVEENYTSQCSDAFKSAEVSRSASHRFSSDFSKDSSSRKPTTSVLTQPKSQALAVASTAISTKKRCSKTTFSQSDLFEQADRILWQARCLAEEWRGCFKAHLRFGSVAAELREVVESEAATLLFLGCNSVNHPIVQKLGWNLPCSVLGIPSD